MPSILAPRPVAGGCSGCLNQSSRKIEQLTGMYESDSSNKSNSSFLGFSGRKKRNNKKRPPPISISVGSVNVFMAGNTFNSRASHDIYRTPPTTQTLPPVPCMKQLCKEVQDFLATTPTLSHRKHLPDHVWPPRISSTMSSAELPAELAANPSSDIAELPGSDPSPEPLLEHTEKLQDLDASPSSTSTITPTKVEKVQLTPPETPEASPIPVSATEMNRGWELASGSSKVKEPSKNGKTLSMMDIDELLDIFPDLTPQEINDHWRPLIAKQCYLLKGALKNFERQGIDLLQLSGQNNNLIYTVETPEEARERRRQESQMDIALVRKECENRLLVKDAELDAFKAAYESETAILSTFIDQHHDLDRSPELRDPELNALVNEHSRKRDGEQPNVGVGNDYIFVSKKEHTERTLDIHSLRVQLEDIDGLATHYEEKMNEHAAEVRSLRKEVKGLLKDQAQHSKEIADKDHQIASLNRKISQVMKMFPSHSHHHSESGTIGPPAQYDKDLPSPKPAEWKKEQEKTDSEKQEYREEMIARLPRCFVESENFIYRPNGKPESSDSEEVIDRFQTLNVEGEEFPFFLSDK